MLGAAAILGLVACGSSDDNTQPPAGTAGTAGSAGSAGKGGTAGAGGEAGQAGTSGGAGTAGGGGEAGAGDLLSGNIMLTENESAAAGFSNMAFVGFTKTTGKGDSPTCGVETVGDCKVIEAPVCDPACNTGDGEYCAWNDTCEPECAVTAGTPANASLKAGDVAIKGGSHQDNITCTFDDKTKSYQCDLEAAQDWWDGGDPMQVSAPGDEFPAFSVNITAPDPLTLSGTLTKADFDGSSDVALKWDTDNPADWVTISILTDKVGKSVVCNVEDTGSFDVPKAAIAQLTGSPTMFVVSMIRTATRHDTAGSNGQVTVTVSPTGVTQTVM